MVLLRTLFNLISRAPHLREIEAADFNPGNDAGSLSPLLAREVNSANQKPRGAIVPVERDHNLNSQRYHRGGSHRLSNLLSTRCVPPYALAVASFPYFLVAN